MNLKYVHFILSRPQLGENIGSVARAIKNFSIKNLRIVKPRCDWPNNKRATATAVGAKDVLKSSKTYDSLEESIGDLDLVFATTSRIRKVNKNVISIYDLKKKIKKTQKIGIIFGAESSGLTNNEINCADYLVKIPTNKDFSSINLSHSAILFSYEIFKIFLNKKIFYKSNYKSSRANKSQINKFMKFIINGLDKKGFLQPEHKRSSMIRNISNIFYRVDLSEQEIRILLGIFSTLNEIKTKT